MNKHLASILLSFVCQFAFFEASSAASFEERHPNTLKHSPETEARLDKWFRNDKYGVFIHFGAYSQLAGRYKGKDDNGPYAEWAMMSFAIPLKEYREEVVGRFNPTKFNADEWARKFKEFGMRYVVITSKHHDGFALFKSGATDYNVVDGSPFKRDIIKELEQACHKHGLKFGVYYSQAFDWSEPGAPFPWIDRIKKIHPELPANFNGATPESMEAYLAKKALPQVEELMKNYKIDLIWFDTPEWMKPDQAKRFVDVIRKHNPDCLISSRILCWPKSGVKAEELQYFDYVSLDDKEVPPHKPSLTTESPDSVSTSYGYKTHGPLRYHSIQETIHRFVHTVCAGGNYLLNFGPMGDGSIDPKAVEIFSAVSAWLKDNGESIYATQGNPLPARPAWGDANLSKDGKNLYLHVMKWPADGKLTVEGVTPKVAAVSFLAPKAADKKIAFAQEGQKLKLTLPGAAFDTNATVVKVTLAKPFQAAAKK